MSLKKKNFQSQKKRESTVQKHLVNSIEKLLLKAGYASDKIGVMGGTGAIGRFRIDVTTSSMYSDRGRQDVYIDIGLFHFRVEVKTGNGKPSDYQEERYEIDKEMLPGRAFIVHGIGGVDKWLNNLPRHMAEQQRHIVLKGYEQMEHIQEVINLEIDFEFNNLP